jgi:hypothetical protein
MEADDPLEQKKAQSGVAVTQTFYNDRMFSFYQNSSSLFENENF